jgi:hypothetical protein
MVATFDFFPYSTGDGSSMTATRFQGINRMIRTNGIFSTNVPLDTSTTDLYVIPGAVGLTVNIKPGTAFVYGTYWGHSGDDSEVTLNANSSGDTRIDLVVLRADFVNNITSYIAIEGTPDPSPVAPDAIQNSTTWDIPLATVSIVDGAISISSGDITDERTRSTQGPSCFISSEQTGTGSTQDIPHGLGLIPFSVLIVPTDTTDAGIISVGFTTSYTVDSTNITVTATSNLKYVVQAWSI